MRNNLFIIAKSGWRYIGYAASAFLLFSIIDLEFFAFLSFVVMLIFVYVYRNPERQMPFYQQNSFIAPADGVVTAIEELEDSEYAYKIEIESSYFDVGVLRVPMNAQVASINIVRGSRVGKNSKLFSLLNEYAELLFVDNENNSVNIVHREKQGFAPIDIDLVKGQELMQGARYGVMVNGVTSIYLKSNFRLNISVGQELRASETLIGYFS
ncbi:MULTISPECIES: phosphatidylserine decarboxylase [Sulfurimonas]|uniref:phosphatidylserine decarboxylase n=1 Tax=Sulfurimonas TaxID=202746 RepID=UPI0012641451|nr:phosphatidylserine decarboxylase [Sulfurimonas indica]